MLTVIDNHSVDLDRLEPRGTVLDVGCRGFRFADYFAERRFRVIALDPGEKHPQGGWVEFMPLALATYNGSAKLVLMSDLEARYTVGDQEEVDRPYLSVGCITLRDLMSLCNVRDFELIKLNMEGGEFDILDQLHAPVAKQIVVSFHEHTPRKRGQAAIDGLIQKLGKWYDVVRHEWDERYCAGRNAWDTVLKRR